MLALLCRRCCESYDTALLFCLLITHACVSNFGSSRSVQEALFGTPTASTGAAAGAATSGYTTDSAVARAEVAQRKQVVTSFELVRVCAVCGAGYVMCVEGLCSDLLYCGTIGSREESASNTPTAD